MTAKTNIEKDGFTNSVCLFQCLVCVLTAGFGDTLSCSNKPPLFVLHCMGSSAVLAFLVSQHFCNLTVILSYFFTSDWLPRVFQVRLNKLS